MKKIIVLVLLLISINAEASTVGPADCSAATVNAAIAAAAAGETITLTCTGTVTWDAQIDLSGGKTLAGPGRFDAADTTNHGTWPLVISSTADSTHAIIAMTSADETLNRVTGLKFIDSGTTPLNAISSVGKGTFRIDNCNFYDVPLAVGGRIIKVDGSTGQLNGVIDHNLIYNPSNASYRGTIGSNAQYKGTSATCNGAGAYQRTLTWGGSDFVFYEANYFYNGTIESSLSGDKRVVRYNTFYADTGASNVVPIDGHGTDTGGSHGLGFVAGEVYNNYFSGTATSYDKFVAMRGGKWLTYNNHADAGVGGYLQFLEYRAMEGAYAASLDWNACAGAQCCAAEVGFPTCEQAPEAADFVACYPLPQQINNTYLWNNTQGAGNMTVTVPNVGANQTFIVAARDYFTSAYSYTPYTCPHPLVGSGSCNSSSYGLGGYITGTANMNIGGGPGFKLDGGAAFTLQ